MAIILDSTILFDICKKLMDGHVSYALNAKAENNDDSKNITQLDCSGFVKFVIYKASGNSKISFDGGTEWQKDKCDTLKLEKVDYSTAGKFDGWLRIAFIKYPYIKGETHQAGHVWLIHDGKTLESHGGTGPDRRGWDTEILKNDVTACYKLAPLFTIFDAAISLSDMA